MKQYKILIMVLALTVLYSSSCQAVERWQIRQDLIEVIDRDHIILEEDGIPEALIERLSEYSVVVLGEGSHYTYEFPQLGVEIALALYDSGYRLILIEFYHSFNAQIEEYVLNRTEQLDPFLEQAYGPFLTQVQEFNIGLPDESKVHVQAVDINHRPEQYATALQRLANGIPESDIIREFISNTANALNIEELENFYQLLLVSEESFKRSWGEAIYDWILEMTWVQLATLPIRANWESDHVQAHEMREEVIKELVERRLDQDNNHVVVYFGGNHIQREHLMGTEKEWLGGYLANRSPHTAGDTFLLYLTAAKSDYLREREITRFDIRENHNWSELFRVLTDRAKGKPAFLPLDDKIFATETITVNYQGSVLRHKPKEQFDGFILLPEIHSVSSTE